MFTRNAASGLLAAALAVAGGAPAAAAPIDLAKPFGIVLGAPLPANLPVVDTSEMEGETLVTLEGAPEPGDAFATMSFTAVTDSSGKVRSVVASGTTPETMSCMALKAAYLELVAAHPGAVTAERRQVSPGRMQDFKGWTGFVQVDTDGTKTEGQGGVLVAKPYRVEIMVACDLFSGITVSLEE